LAADRCLYCGALLPGRVPQPRVLRTSHVPEHTHRGVAWLFWVFSLLLISNVGLSWFLREQPDVDPMPEPAVRTAAIALTMVEVVDTILVIAAAIICARFIRVPRGIGLHRRLGWILGLPLLAILLLINHGYHWLLLTMAGVEPEGDRLLQSGHHQIWLIALMCIQPAIIEELFFRRLVFDFFHAHTTVGTAAFASAVMFAAAHTGGFLSIPYLALFGFTLAWLRWFTGSLALPIILHFLHNLLISWHELAAT
jgi:membrane protease YdiL (CAAX protease family)